jgi:putative phage-type endonuclease
MTDLTIARIVKDPDATREAIMAVSDAHFIGNWSTEDKEWHEVRKNGITGTDVGTIVGLNPWLSPYALWAKKLDKIPDDFRDSEAMYWGRAAEAIIVQRFAEEHPDFEIYYNVGTWCHHERDWQIANPDAVYKKPDGVWGVLEIKTAQFEDSFDLTNNVVPKHYKAQELWYCDVFGFGEYTLAALFHGNRYHEFTGYVDAFEADSNREAAGNFRELILTDKAPDFDGALSTYEVVRKQHPEIDDTEVELGDLGMYYFLAAEEYATAETKLTELKTRVLDAMGNAKRGLVFDEWKLSRMAKGQGTPYLAAKRK